MVLPSCVRLIPGRSRSELDGVYCIRCPCFVIYGSTPVLGDGSISGTEPERKLMLQIIGQYFLDRSNIFLVNLNSQSIDKNKYSVIVCVDRSTDRGPTRDLREQLLLHQRTNDGERGAFKCSIIWYICGTINMDIFSIQMFYMVYMWSNQYGYILHSNVLVKHSIVIFSIQIETFNC